MKLTSDLVMIASCAISKKVNEVNKQKLKIVSVLTFESRTLGSEQLIADREKRLVFFRSIEGIANLYKSLI